MASLTSVKKQAEFILRTPLLRQIIVPAAQVFTKFAGYRKMGLRLDDLLIEETPIMQKAISRLPAEESYARNYRLLTAHHLSGNASILPPSKELKPEEDIAYLEPYLLEVEKEFAEKDELNNLSLKK